MTKRASPPQDISTRDAFRLIVRLLSVLRWRVGLLVLLLAAMAVLESAGVMLLVPLLGAIGLDIEGGSIGSLAVTTTSILAALGLTPTLPIVLGIFLGVNLLLSFLRRTLTIFSAAFEQEIVRSLVARLYGAIVRMDWLAFSRMRASDLMVALTTSAERSGVAASQALTIAAGLGVALVYIVLALRVSVPMTVVTFLCGVAIMLSMRRRTATSTAIGERFTSVSEEFQAAVSDDLSGMKTVRSVTGEARSLARLIGLTELVSDARIASARHYANGTWLVDLGSLLLLSALVLVAVEGLDLAGSGLLLSLFLFSRIVPRLAGLMNNLHHLTSFLPSLKSINDLEAACLMNAERSQGSADPLTLRQAVRLDSVTFRYGPDRPAALTNLSLEIRRGTTVALLGPSGSGKTTTADLVM
jgi:ABC-type multidrug transport system fused ATPase/permease subunit